jgi:hypothetical protein
MKNIALLFFFLISFNAISQSMNNDRIDSLLTDIAKEVKKEGNSWTFKYMRGYMMMITDQTNNRMRIIMPVTEEKKVSKKELIACMEANFHTALDVKYAFSNGYLWSVFIHPLKELSDDQFSDALMQVYYAAVTFGTTYSSTDLVFPDSKE